jgi:hypothetical protein
MRPSAPAGTATGALRTSDGRERVPSLAPKLDGRSSAPERYWTRKLRNSSAMSALIAFAAAISAEPAAASPFFCFASPRP